MDFKLLIFCIAFVLFGFVAQTQANNVTSSGIIGMSESRMPVVFIGHGSPMNAIEENEYTDMWRKLGETLPRPKAIVMVSAHWYIRRTAVTAMETPETIHDFGGFPKALYDAQYPAPGSPQLAQQVADLLSPYAVALDQEWGLDHGAWVVLTRMYPNADIPVVQLSIDQTKPPIYHYELGQKLKTLRDEGILVIGSGNVVHNLREMLRSENAKPYPWALTFNEFVRQNLNWQGDDANEHPLVNFKNYDGAAQSCPTPEHYLPLLYALGARQGDEPVTILIDGNVMGSLSMLAVQIGTTSN